MWYKNAYRRHLCDMHLTDWDDSFFSEFSPECYVENLKLAKVQNAMIYFQSHVGLCYYPTECGVMHRAFAGREDLIRRVCDLCHENGISVTGYCGSPLTTKKGEIRQHHFAHKQNHLCSDTWERSHSYDISPWHNEWQSLFPKENQEVKLSLGDTKHRADVMIDRTVIEFQHSIMPVKAFDDRNNFYFNLGNKVIWLFDLSDLLEDQLFYKETDVGLEGKYVYPDSVEINNAMHYLYSDQSMICYTEKTTDKYDTLPKLLMNEHILITDFEEHMQRDVEWLLERGYIFEDNDKRVCINKEKAYILKELFENGVLSVSYFGGTIRKELDNYIQSGQLTLEKTLFTRQEQDFLDYMLNVQQFNNGPELRNKYVHGTYPLDERHQERDYLELLKIMILIIIKINEEFCLREDRIRHS